MEVRKRQGEKVRRRREVEKEGKAFLTCSHSEGRNVKNLCPLLKKRLVIWKLGCEGMFLQDRFPLS